MEKIIHGFVVELSRQILLNGDWGSDDCEWDWESEYHEFDNRSDAEKFFKKQKKVFSADCPVIRMFHYDITYINGYAVSENFGDEIKEYITENGKVVVWEMET